MKKNLYDLISKIEREKELLNEIYTRQGSLLGEDLQSKSREIDKLIISYIKLRENNK